MSIQTNMTNYPQRAVVDKTMRGCAVVATSLAIIPLFLIIGYVLIIGGGALSWEFFTDTYRPPIVTDVEFVIDPATGLPLLDEAGNFVEAETDLSQVQARGGVLHGIVGTLMITMTALLIALPIGIMAGIYLAEYPDTPFNTFIRFCSDVLSGAPSIVVGVVGFTLLVQQTRTYSGLAGAVALTFLMVPTIARTTEEILKLVPTATREAAMAMGAPMWYSTLTVVVPTALTGIVTGALLAFARGAGETAPLLLTIQGNSNLSFNLLAPMAALPLLTYKYIESPFPSENQLAWGSAFVLMMLVLGVNLLVRLTTARMKRGVN
ncbi:MAG: phosphate ABC transporter permease PstA [Oscillochloridaceae bacterium umkhey_bin13]